MLDDLTTYRLQDFLLFDAATYEGLFAQMNGAFWLLPAATVLAGLATLVAIRMKVWAAMRIAAAVMAAAFALSATLFFLGVYATINWAAVYPAWLFFGQAGLLVLLGTLAGRLEPLVDRNSPRALVATIVTMHTLLVHPLVASATGRAFDGLEWFGLAPDPTAMATLGLLAFTRSRWRFLLALAPVLWLTVSFLTLWTLELDGQAAVLAAGSVLGVVALFLPASAKSGRVSPAAQPGAAQESRPAAAGTRRPARQPKQAAPATLVPSAPVRSDTRRR
ncbi:DUF6064 family protein [Aurantimonas endophytica]|uniref:MFS transporter permease n=1 Tax=Aurantimonas endophytica TaxID=1522175 RepID=A0A7W6MPA9_9HYPH|nr:DUF6064 family protein [Aurantimonas endophytica]MBB4002734.1 hypothetical protein [Aurantimonas endophytica]MCO6403612.1 hypothetical protein [Aurantimonas endophytica]